MKIIRLSTFLDLGGLETRLANISYWNDDNEWVFMCLNREGKAAETIKNNNKRVINLNTKPSIYSLSSFFKVYQIIKKEKPDIIHTSGAEANFHGVLAAKIAGVPTIIAEEIGIPNHGKLARILFGLIYKIPQYIIGNSQQVLDSVHAVNFVPFLKLKKVENPIIFKNLMETKNDSSTKFNISMVSRLEPVKNIEGVINVLVSLKIDGFKNIQLVIAGSGSIEKKLKEKVKELNLDNDVIFLGAVSDPYMVYQKSDLYLLNSFTEGFSNSLLEAMYSKTPVLSTAVGSAPEIIQDQINGFLIPPNNEEALKKKMIEIMAFKKEELIEIGINGNRKVISEFSLENHIEKLMEIYQK